MATQQTTGRRPGRPRKNVIASGPVPQASSKKEVPVAAPQARASFTSELKAFKADILVKSYYNLARRLFKDGQFDELANIGKLLTRRMADLRRENQGGSTLH